MLTYAMDKRGNKTKTRYLYEMIRGDIRAGRIAPGERMPSKRALAAHLRISALTVENTYLLLEEEGYLISRARSGFYVSDMPPAGAEAAEHSLTALPLLPEDVPSAPAEGSQSYLPAMARIMRRILTEEPYVLEMRSPNMGCAVLRNAIAEYLLRFRGMTVLPERIVVGSGSEYLYGLIVQMLGREVIYGIETPSYPKIRQVYEVSGAEVELLPMGPDGIESRALDQSTAGVLHVTPFHSFPTDITATAEKRQEYLRWAAERDAILVEDDYASEFSFSKKPLETLFALDRSGRVIYMNTFSKSIAPSFRAGYMVLPERLMPVFEEKLSFYACTVPVLDQYLLAHFIRDGSFERHLNRLRRDARS